MKKMFKLLMCAAIVAAGFTACSEEVIPIDNPEGPGVTPGEKESQPTNATFSFKLSDASTKSVYPDGSDPQTVTDFRVLIFRTADNTLEVDTVKSVGASTDSLLTITLLSGSKRIFVYANGGFTSGGAPVVNTAPAYLGTPATGSINTLADVNNIFRFVTTATPPAGYFSDVPLMHSLIYPSGITTLPPAKFFFSSRMNEPVKNLEPGVSAADSKDPDNTNYLKLQIERPVAKVAITKSATSDPTGITGSTKILTRDSAGIISDVQYRFWSVNVGFYPFQNYEGAALKTPEYLPTSPADTVVLKNYYARELGKFTSATAPNDYIAIPNRTGVPSAGSFYYISENSPSIKMRGNTTYAEVQTTFLPTQFHYVKLNTTEYTTHGGVNFVASAVAGTNGTFTVYPASTDLATASDMYLFKETGVPGLLENTLFAGPDAVKLAKKITYHLLNPTTPPLSAGIDAPAYVAITPAEIEAFFVKFEAGKAYYRLDIGNPSSGTNDYTVRRNYYYDAHITGFARLGESGSIKLLNPVNDVLAGTTNLTVVITLRNWEGVAIPGDL
ncbi:MAG: hypothetical protein LBU37_01635 [Tannerellaceae bacterium]|nr:hypothetical protein [Tannerellaceae bacterium]